MTTLVFAVVLLAAALHAGWNALVKSGADKVTSMAAVVIGQAATGTLCVLVLPLPAPESWPYILGSVVLHLGYQFFLIAAYRTGEFSQVYPLARGVAPLLVALVSVAVLGVRLNMAEWLGILMIASGLASLSLVGTSFFSGAEARRGHIMALMTGVFIAAYSLNDGVGARLAGTPVGFFGWITLLNGLALALILAIWRPRTLRALPKAAKTMIIGGGASFIAYALVVWAFTQAPIALVTALRETSIIFALLIAVGVMGEKLDLRRVFATALTFAGVILLRFGKS